MMGIIKAFMTAIFASALFAPFLASPAYSAGLILNVPVKIQEQREWCWAASSQAALEYYGSVQVQCTIANTGCGRSDCCGPYSSNPCNEPKPFGTIQNILTRSGVNSNVLSGALFWVTCVEEINTGKPFVIGIDYYVNGKPKGGHYVVGRGYDLSGQYIDYMDPATGYKSNLYTWLVKHSYQANPAEFVTVEWGESLRITTNPPAGGTGAAAAAAATATKILPTILNVVLRSEE